jgi:hypothetical protein
MFFYVVFHWERCRGSWSTGLQGVNFWNRQKTVPFGQHFAVDMSLVNIQQQGDTRPTGAVPLRLPVSVRRSASLAKCSALLKGDGSQVNELRRRCCEGAMFLDWSNVCCSVLLCY